MRIFDEMQNEETHEAAFATITAVYIDTQARKSLRIPTDVAGRITTMRLHRDALYWIDSLPTLAPNRIDLQQ